MLSRLWVFLLVFNAEAAAVAQSCQVRFVWGNVAALICGEKNVFIKTGQEILSTKVILSSIKRAGPSGTEVIVSSEGKMEVLSWAEVKNNEVKEEEESSLQISSTFSKEDTQKESEKLAEKTEKAKKTRTLEDWKLLHSLEIDNILNISDLSEEELDQVLLEARDCSDTIRREVLVTCIHKDENEKNSKSDQQNSDQKSKVGDKTSPSSKPSSN